MPSLFVFVSLFYISPIIRLSFCSLLRYGAESLTRVDEDKVINTHEDDVAIPITEEFVYHGAKRRNRVVEDSPQKEGKKTSDREDYDNSREKTIVATGFNPEEHSTFTQYVLEVLFVLICLCFCLLGLVCCLVYFAEFDYYLESYSQEHPGI
jgi:hypothetical protein